MEGVDQILRLVTRSFSSMIAYFPHLDIKIIHFIKLNGLMVFLSLEPKCPLVAPPYPGKTIGFK